MKGWWHLFCTILTWISEDSNMDYYRYTCNYTLSWLWANQSLTVLTPYDYMLRREEIPLIFQQRSPGGTPKKQPRSRGSPSSLCNGYRTATPLYKALINGMHHKFRNIRPPSPVLQYSEMSKGFTPEPLWNLVACGILQTAYEDFI
jgi:hypothetical protein